jgi:hypothetical protein
MTYHARDGMCNRLRAAGLPPHVIEAIDRRVDEWARRTPEKRVRAVRLAVLDRQYHSGISNGDTVWGIFRDSVPLTVMLRRSSQGPPRADSVELVE